MTTKIKNILVAVGFALLFIFTLAVTALTLYVGDFR